VRTPPFFVVEYTGKPRKRGPNKCTPRRTQKSEPISAHPCIFFGEGFFYSSHQKLKFDVFLSQTLPQPRRCLTSFWCPVSLGCLLHCQGLWCAMPERDLYEVFFFCIFIKITQQCLSLQMHHQKMGGGQEAKIHHQRVFNSNAKF
jgi:hypothetical protein